MKLLNFKNYIYSFFFLSTFVYFSSSYASPILQLDPDFLYSSQDKDSLHQIKYYPESKKKFEEVFINLRKSLETPREGVLLMKLAYILGEFDEFNRIAKFVLRKQPDNEEVKLLLAYQAISNGRSYLADFYTSKLRSPTLASQILNLRGLISFQKGNGIEALGILKQGLKKDKKNYALGMNLGIIYLHYKMFKAAEKHFTSMTRTFSNGYDAQLHLAIAYAAQKKLDKAKGIVANLLELFPSSSILKRMIKKVDK